MRNKFVGIAYASRCDKGVRSCVRSFFFIAHLSPRPKVSYCHQAMSVVCRQQFALNGIVSKTIRALIFGMKHCLVDLYRMRSNGGPGIQNGSAEVGACVRK